MLTRIALAFALLLSAANQLPAADPIRVVSLGDSITKGVRSGVKAEETFSAVVQEALNKRGQTTEVINIGIGGERTDQALKRLDKDVVGRQPAIVLIMYGTNDSYVDKGATVSRITAEQYAQNLTEIVAKLRKSKIQPILMTEPRWGDKATPNGVGEHPNVRLEQYVKVCREVAEQTKTPLVDHFQIWSDKNKAGTDIGTWTTDQCHPNPEGHRILAEAILPVLKDVLDKKQ